MVCALCALLWPHYNPSHVVCETTPLCSFIYSYDGDGVRTISGSDRRCCGSRKLADCACRDWQSSGSQRGALSRQELRVPAGSDCRANRRYRERSCELPGHHVEQLEVERVCVVATREDRARDWRSRARTRALAATHRGRAIESAV